MKKINIYKALDKLEQQARDNAPSEPFKVVYLWNGEEPPEGAEEDKNTMWIQVLPPCTQRA